MSHQAPEQPEPLRVRTPEYNQPTKKKSGWIYLLIPLALLLIVGVGGTAFVVYNFVIGDPVADCKAEIGDFVDSISAVDARLDTGLTNNDLGNAVADASVESNKVDESAAQDISEKCGDALDEANQALDLYAKSYQDWNDCITDWSCDPDDMTLVYQLDWLMASTHVENAERLMDGKEKKPSEDEGDSA